LSSGPRRAYGADVPDCDSTLLSRRELEVVELVVDGLTNHEIAVRLAITERTVQAHVAAARAKLGARSRTQLAVMVLRRGIVPLEP
jgi:DNA-binding NarL/FixJ family response regulator